MDVHDARRAMAANRIRRRYLKGLACASALALAPSARAAAVPPARLAPGEWIELPGTAMQRVFPRREDHPAWGAVGPRAVTGAWGGGALDTRRAVLVLTGGGHADYGGNEVYQFHLEALRWERATEPSPMRPLGNGRYEVTGSESPVSSHTYDGLTYLPNVDRIFKFGGSYFLLGTAYDRHGYLYSVEHRSWTRTSAAPIECIEVASDYDERTGHAVVSTGAGLLHYSPTDDTWTLGPQASPWAPAGTAAIDPLHRLFVQTMSTTGALQYYRLDEPSARRSTPLRGERPWGGHPGMAYHPRARALVIWAGGPEVWIVQCSDWSVRHIASGHGPKPAVQSNGIYGRWQYVPSIDAFVGYANASDNVWLYRLPETGVPTTSTRNAWPA